MDLNQIVQVGETSEKTFQVQELDIASLVGSGSLDVLATPSMIAFMETVAFEMLEYRLPDGYDSVGVLVDVRHLAATPLGCQVRVVCEVLEIDGRRVTFSVQAWDPHEKIGEGRHQRVVINVARFLERLEGKMGK